MGKTENTSSTLGRLRLLSQPGKVHRLVAMLALVVAGGVLTLSVLSFDPHDPPAVTVYPTAEPANLCGPTGAWIAFQLFESFGLAAYVVVGTVVALTIRLLQGKVLQEPLTATTGWVLVLVSLATLVSVFVPSWMAGSVSLLGPGGQVGALGRAVLTTHFGPGGATLLGCSGLLAGSLLLHDRVVFRVMSWVVLSLPKRLLMLLGKLDPNPSPQAETYSLAAEPSGSESLGESLGLGKRKRPHAQDKPRQESHWLAGSQSVPMDDAGSPAGSAGETSSEAERPDEAAESERPELTVNKPRSKSARQKVIEQLHAASREAETGDHQTGEYQLPSVELLEEGEEIDYAHQEQDVRQKAHILEKTFADFGFDVRVVAVDTGPVIAQFEIELAPGLRLAKITGLSDDLAIALRVPSVRIVAPIPGKNTVGIEVPNAERSLVRMREVMEESASKVRKFRIPLYLGKDVSGGAMVCDLAKMPHLLIAGRTGTGKSVCLNTIICSLLMTRSPDEVKMLLIDPKQVEFHDFRRIPHLLHPVVTDPDKAEPILAWAVDKMEERYALLAAAGVRNIDGYNQLSPEELRRRIDQERFSQSSEDGGLDPDAEIADQLPYIVIVVDEFADLMMTAGKEIESHIIRLAQKSRAVGIHLVLATQKPTVDVITGLIKSNLPARIAFQVASRTDSRVVLDEMGADKLLGMGDMLMLSPATNSLVRGQGTFIGDSEIRAVVDTVATTEPEFLDELLNLKPRGEESEVGQIRKDRDDLYEQAVEIVVREGRGSVSLLQRSLGIGYGRAARLIDYMEEDGIVDKYNGSKARDVLMSVDQWATQRRGESDDFADRSHEAAASGHLVRPRSQPRPAVDLTPSESYVEEPPFDPNPWSDSDWDEDQEGDAFEEDDDLFPNEDQEAVSEKFAFEED